MKIKKKALFQKALVYNNFCFVNDNKLNIAQFFCFDLGITINQK